MTDKLPPQLLALFQPRPPLRYIPPQDSSPETRATKKSELSGIAAFLAPLEEYKEEDEYKPTESWLQKRDRKRAEKKQRAEQMSKDEFSGFKPDEDPKIKGDAGKTLFVGRLNYDAKESDLEREFGRFGPIERIRIIKDEFTDKPKKRSRGYAFVVYEREKDMRVAYKETDGIRIKDRRVVVDVERGRMVPGWRPRRFGGGLGGRGYTKQAPAKPTFGAPGGPGSFDRGFRGGGFRGGDRGGFRGGFRGGDRGGFGGGDRGGSDRGGGDRGGYGGRGGIGYQDRGGGGGGFGGRQGGYQNGAPPLNAPSGPGGRGGYGAGSPNSYEDRRSGYGAGGGGREQRGMTGSNRDPVGGRDRGYEERDRHGGGGGAGGGGGRREDDYGSRKRYHDGDGYDDSRSKRRY